jgi:hypothetical protein
VIYHWETSRSAKCLENVVPVSFTGTIQCDAYAARGLALAGMLGARTPRLLRGP